MSTLYQPWELWKMSALPPSLLEVRDEIEQLLDDDGDMAEMYLTEKKERSEAFTLENLGNHESLFAVNSKTAPVSPVGPLMDCRSCNEHLALLWVFKTWNLIKFV
ncbi:hypothetical protein ACFE04_020435 [Oxalis oulophora]